MEKAKNFIKTYWITILIFIAMICGYKYIADTGMFGGFLFPKVDKITLATTENISTLFLNMIYSFQLMIPAILIAVIIAILSGTALGMNPKLRKIVYPVIYSISVIPSILMSPFALLLAPNFRTASLFLVVYNTVWATLFATINGIMTIDKIYLDKAETLELNRAEKLFQVILPAAMPSILSGFITSLRGSFVVLVYAEMYGAKYGMGFYVKKYAEYGLYDRAWSGFIFMVIVLVFVMQIFERAKNHILRWTLNN
ncbi:ABC-type nitrate/sulfonate/bicarbonate transport system, permease component [Lachnospiraceae bacterium JC7]|nr:ABC-type nitrate/sulfonate/bicarbonate transport system, permease component [Lachnospiraceae bacterium JC7]